MKGEPTIWPAPPSMKSWRTVELRSVQADLVEAQRRWPLSLNRYPVNAGTTGSAGVVVVVVGGAGPVNDSTIV